MASLFCGLAGYHHPIMRYISRLGKMKGGWFRMMEDVALKFKAMFYEDVDVNFNC
jgi:hypothetical protein